MSLLSSDYSNWADKKITACVLLLLLELFVDGAETATQREIENHLELGRQFLATGEFSDALTHYHAAVEGDPTNYLTLYKRGTVYIVLGKTRFALNDFTKALELKPDFTSARIQRGTLHMKCGDYHNAAIDFVQVLNEDPQNHQVREYYNRLQPALEQWDLVQDTIDHGDYHNAINLLTQLLEVSPWSIEFRKERAECYVQLNDILSAVSDYRSVNKLSQDSTEGFYKLSVLLYGIGHATSALKEIRDCLKFDPEHKDCFTFYKKLKKIEKALTNAETSRDENRFSDCIAASEIVIKNEKENPMIIYTAKQFLCNCYVKDEQYTQAIETCREAIDIKKNAGTFCDRADAYLGAEMYDDAIHDFHAALELDDSFSRAKEGIEKAKRLQKQSERRDYYKILDVKKTATKQEIVKAYRKAAQKWHPDNFKGAEQKIAEKKFINIAAAKEVLTDPEKRKQFDMGEDPLDPENGQNGFRGGNPFGNFHHGSPFQFKFHFN